MNYFPTHAPSLYTFLKYCFLGVVVSLVSCKTDDFKDFADASLTQEGTYALPVGTVNFTLEDILEDDTTLTIGADNGIKLVYREDDFFQLTAAELLDDLTGDIEENFSQSSKIGDLEVDDLSQGTSILFENILDDFTDVILANYIQSADGTMAVVPPFEESILSVEQVPAFTDYTSLKLATGAMFLSVTNNLFFDIEDYSIDVKDIGTNQFLGTFEFDYIAAGATKTSEIGLAGKTISNEFEVVMSTLKSPGTGTQQVLVDLSSKLEVNFSVEGVTISEGQVLIPAGVLLEDEMDFEFMLDNEEKIKSIELNDADVTYEINSDLQAAFQVDLTFPTITRNNSPITQTLLVSQGGGASTGSMDFSNTIWLLDGDPDQPFNKIKVDYEVSLPNGSGGQLNIDAEDEVSITFKLNDLDVAEVIGYFGFRQEEFEENTFDLGFDFSLFSDGSSPLLFSDPTMRVEITNSFGIPLLGEFNATANGFFGEQADLNPPKIVINHPTLSEMGQSSNTLFVMNKFNSDLVGMLAVYPSDIDYVGSATINPNNDPSVLNYIRSDSELSASVEFDLPFKFQAQNLIYRDTTDAVDLGTGAGGYTVEDIAEGELKIVYDNGLPLQSKVSLIAMDKNGNQAIIADQIPFEAAAVDADGKVPTNGSARGEAFIDLTSEQIQWLDEADQYIYLIQFQTKDEGQTPVAMYSDYQVDLGVGIKLEVLKD
ncbi:MAG: hypothetical protein AAFZ15_08415 [Bacteroidota bacterium]